MTQKVTVAKVVDAVGSVLLFTLFLVIPSLAIVATCAAVPVLAWKCAVSP